MKRWLVMILLGSLYKTGYAQELPESFDLRTVDGTNYSTSVKSQISGTCWAHGTMAAIESNLQKTGVWTHEGESGEPNLAEYHLDWWNGFNQHNNDDRDPPAGGGLDVHMGGDYRVATAYLSRGEGAIRDSDGQSYATPPLRHSDSYHTYYPRHVEWFVDDQSLSNMPAIKRAIMNHGAIGTCMFWGGGFFTYNGGGTHYQPPSDSNDPNHSIAIIGWDDTKSTQYASNGAWLCKNSWGASWNGDGHLWISYYDKHACKEPQMGAVSFRDVVRQSYLNVYYHDYHGWRDTLATTTAFNAFTAQTNESLVAVSFFTASDLVDYDVRVYRQFSNGTLSMPVSSATGQLECTGFHTVDLGTKVSLRTGRPFFVYLSVSHGGQPYDRTSDVPVLLGKPVSPDKFATFSQYLERISKMDTQAKIGTEVVSRAGGGESYFLSGANWVDLTNVSVTASFCIKGLTDQADLNEDTDNDGIPDWWEEDYFGDPANCQPTGNADEDPHNNLDEYVAGTDPTNSASFFAVAGAARQTGLGFIIDWQPVSGRVYDVSWATNLAAGSFQPLATGMEAPQGSYTDAVHNAEYRGFYRLEVRLK